MARAAPTPIFRAIHSAYPLPPKKYPSRSSVALAAFARRTSRYGTGPIVPSMMRRSQAEYGSHTTNATTSPAGTIAAAWPSRISATISCSGYLCRSHPTTLAPTTYGTVRSATARHVVAGRAAAAVVGGAAADIDVRVSHGSPAL